MGSRTAISPPAGAVCASNDARRKWPRDTDLLPRFGDRSEFEARKQGLPPTAREDPASAVVLAEPTGNLGPRQCRRHAPAMMWIRGDRRRLSDRDRVRSGSSWRRAIHPKERNREWLVQVAPVLLREVTVAEIAVANVQAVVVPENRLAMSLLGMSFLGMGCRISNQRGGCSSTLRYLTERILWRNSLNQ